MKKLNIHFVGIKGVGMTPLALIAKGAGFNVTGSDIGDEFITDGALRKAKIIPLVGFSEENIKNPDLVIITGAHGGYDNIEVKAAVEKKIKVITQGEAVGLFMDGEIFGRHQIGISVAGTHGKTTTSAMIATLLKDNGLDPSYVIGTGEVSSLSAPGQYGKGKYFVAEADEYATEPKYNKKPKFMWQFPQIAILTNIEFDHPDIYASLAEVKDAYLQFVNQLDKKSVLIACIDDPEIRSMLKSSAVRVITYGFSKDADYVLDKVHISGSHMFFTVSSRGMILSNFMINVIGEYNALNALSAVIVGLELGISSEKIKKGIMGFNGSKRRLEYVGELATGGLVYDDYAHHPTEIKKTLHALRLQYPNKKILAIFQPHTYSRTKKLFDQFIDSFVDVDSVILTEIYPSLREQPDPEVTSSRLVDKMKYHHKNVTFLSTIQDVVKYLNENRYRSDTIIVTMGAGDIYKIHSELKLV
jgi:UDP-N-acetylmuramate--alanine ligase